MIYSTRPFKMQTDMEDNRPLAVRRKRRASTGLGSPSKDSSQPTTSGATASRQEMTTPKTPTKVKKRVRFSDPGPQILDDASSTGITPHIKRTTLSSNVRPLSLNRLPVKSPRQRRSMPAMLTLNPSASLPTPPASGDIHFAPLRQMLDDRMKRRLRRNHLSEEINDINTEKVTANNRRDEEIRRLKEELELVKHSRNEIMDDAHDGGTIVNKTKELEEEILRLKEEMRCRSMPAESSSPAGTGNEADFWLTAPSDHQNANEDDGFQINDHSEHLDTKYSLSMMAETGTQTSLTSSRMVQLEGHIAEQTEHIIQARLDLEYVCPGETTIGLEVSGGNCKGVLNALLDRLRAAQGKLRVSESALDASKVQETNMRNNFNGALHELDRARQFGNEKETQHTLSLTSLQKAGDKIHELEIDADEKQRSLIRLQDALQKYRDEVKDLESLVMRLETEYKDTLAALKGEMDEAVADLECHVTAETLGRRQAEAESEQRLLLVRELETREKELKGAMAEKQAIVRELEEELQNAKHSREVEVGGLNARIGDISSTLSGVKEDLAKVESEKMRLVGLMEQEKQVALRVVNSMKDELQRCLTTFETVTTSYEKDTQARSMEWAEYKGLLTPNSAVKFRDVDHCEGFVEIRRGKTRSRRGLDSGIGILEEDDEDGI